MLQHVKSREEREKNHIKDSQSLEIVRENKRTKEQKRVMDTGRNNRRGPCAYTTKDTTRIR
jgi:hypothetical protein